MNFISLFIVKKSNSNIATEIKSVKYPQIDLCIQEIIIKMDQVILMNLFNLINLLNLLYIYIFLLSLK